MLGIEFEKDPNEILTPRNHLGTLVGLIDIGRQPERKHENYTFAPQHQMVLHIQFPLADNGNPFDYYFTVSCSKKKDQAFYQYLRAFLGDSEEADAKLKRGAVTDALGKSAQIKIGRTEGKKPKIISMMAVTEGTVLPPPTMTPYTFDINKPDMARFDTFLSWIQRAIGTSLTAPQVVKDAYQAKQAAYEARQAKYGKTTAPEIKPGLDPQKHY